LLGSNVTVARLLHEAKQHWQRILTDEGMQIAESDEQPENAETSRPESREGAANVTVLKF
jgi:hypothetical protein